MLCPFLPVASVKHSTYYFQTILKPKAAFIVSISRGLIVSDILILLLPAVGGGNALCFAMPITEMLVALYVVCTIIRYTKNLEAERRISYE